MRGAGYGRPVATLSGLCVLAPPTDLAERLSRVALVIDGDPAPAGPLWLELSGDDDVFDVAATITRATGSPVFAFLGQRTAGVVAVEEHAAAERVSAIALSDAGWSVEPPGTLGAREWHAELVGAGAVDGAFDRLQALMERTRRRCAVSASCRRAGWLDRLRRGVAPR